MLLELDISTLLLNLDTGLPTKSATSTTTVQLLSSLILTNYVDCNSFLPVFTFTILFINTSKIDMKGKDRSTFKFVIFQEFYVVAAVASFVGNPVSRLRSRVKIYNSRIKKGREEGFKWKYYGAGIR